MLQANRNIEGSVRANIVVGVFIDVCAANELIYSSHHGRKPGSRWSPWLVGCAKVNDGSKPAFREKVESVSGQTLIIRSDFR
jgi:hypothetical protein